MYMYSPVSLRRPRYCSSNGSTTTRQDVCIQSNFVESLESTHPTKQMSHWGGGGEGRGKGGREGREGREYQQ